MPQERIVISLLSDSSDDELAPEPNLQQSSAAGTAHHTASLQDKNTPALQTGSQLHQPVGTPASCPQPAETPRWSSFEEVLANSSHPYLASPFASGVLRDQPCLDTPSDQAAETPRKRQRQFRTSPPTTARHYPLESAAPAAPSEHSALSHVPLPTSISPTAKEARDSTPFTAGEQQPTRSVAARHSPSSQSTQPSTEALPDIPAEPLRMAQANSDSTMVIADLDHSDDDEDLQRAIALSLPGCSLQSVTDPALDQEYSPPACYFWLANGDFVWAQTDAGLRFARLLRRLDQGWELQLHEALLPSQCPSAQIQPHFFRGQLVSKGFRQLRVLGHEIAEGRILIHTLAADGALHSERATALRLVPHQVSWPSHQLWSDALDEKLINGLPLAPPGPARAVLPEASGSGEAPPSAFASRASSPLERRSPSADRFEVSEHGSPESSLPQTAPSSENRQPAGHVPHYQTPLKLSAFESMVFRDDSDADLLMDLSSIGLKSKHAHLYTQKL